MITSSVAIVPSLLFFSLPFAPDEDVLHVTICSSVLRLFVLPCFLHFSVFLLVGRAFTVPFRGVQRFVHWSNAGETATELRAKNIYFPPSIRWKALQPRSNGVHLRTSRMIRSRRACQGTYGLVANICSGTLVSSGGTTYGRH